MVARDRSGVIRNNETPELLTTRSPQTTVGIDEDSDEELIWRKAFVPVADAVCRSTPPEQSEIVRSGDMSHASMVARSGEDDADTLALCTQIQIL